MRATKTDTNECFLRPALTGVLVGFDNLARSVALAALNFRNLTILSAMPADSLEWTHKLLGQDR